MKEIKRIEKDIKLFKENIVKIPSENEQYSKVVVLASQYCEDANYYLNKRDYLTAFGCINYAHGLIDAIKILEEK